MNKIKPGALYPAALLCMGLLLLAGCKDLLHPEGPETTEDQQGTGTQRTVTVTFDADGGYPETQTRTIASGSTIGYSYMPSNPTRSGYTFDGWYTWWNGEGSQFTAYTTVSGSMTVYAKWTYEASGISNITYSSVSGGAWTLQSDGRYRSPGISDNGVTKMRISFTSGSSNTSITIQLTVSSESG
ncbi:MAG: InlB B-repeat-containing protein, partial [Treponema sp.]|nr:InlB B-repeat-containing protein [Treponema sp.]